MSLRQFKAAGAAVLFCCLISVTAARATTFTLGYVAADDIGTTNVKSASAPFTASSFTPLTPFNATSDPDKGCDTDAFANFGGAGKGPTGIPTCGDTLIVKGVTNGTVGVTTTGLLTDTTSTNGTGIEFHVEDSEGKGTQNGSLPETLTIGGQSNTFNLPYTVNFGTDADTFQIPAFDIQVCIKNSGQGNCNAQNGMFYWIISPGTMLLTRGGTHGDDDWAFETNLVGCVNTTNSGLGSCGTTPASFISFLAGDPPLVAAEPSASALLLVGLVAFGTARMRRRDAQPRACRAV